MSLRNSCGSLHVGKPQALFCLLHKLCKEYARLFKISFCCAAAAEEGSQLMNNEQDNDHLTVH